MYKVERIVKSISAYNFTDEELVFKIVETNSCQLLALLFGRFYKAIYNRCYGFSKNKEEAEDLTHDVFIRLFTKLKTFKGNSKFSTWLYSFTYNFCVNYVQRNEYKKKEKVTLVTSQIKEEDASEDIDDTRLFQLKSEKSERVLALIAAKERMILLMKYQDDLSIKEISEKLEIGESAVKMRVKRAKQKVICLYKEF